MVSAIVLAAGLSRRMGDANKLLLQYKNKAVVTNVVENILMGGIEELIVVVGYEAGKVQDALKGLPVSFVYNPDYSVGMTSSIVCGVNKALGEGFMVCLSDMVLIAPEEYNLMARSFEQRLSLSPACILIPTWMNEKGNPVIFSSWYREAILRHTEPEGCKGIVQLYQQNVYLMKFPTSHILHDIDLPEDYNKLLQ